MVRFQLLLPAGIALGRSATGLAFLLAPPLRLRRAGSAAAAAVRTLPAEGESWFVKTEVFVRPFPEVRPHLEEHRRWVTDLRSRGYCITSGYRVDEEGRPGGGGLMVLAAGSHGEAEELVLQDPLVANGCVDWTLNGWISEVGELQLR